MTYNYDENCIFCKIARGEERASIVYEDSDVLAFLDINPLTYGHTLIIPKSHFIDITDIPIELLNKISTVSKKIAKKMIEEKGYDGINIVHSTGRSAGQTIFHFHIHLLPRITGQSIGFQEWWFSRAHHTTRKDLDDIAERMKI